MKKSYVSYLLRMWQTGRPDQLGWAASLEDPHSRQLIHFRSMDELWNYLLQVAAAPEETLQTDGEEGFDRLDCLDSR